MFKFFRTQPWQDYVFFIGGLIFDATLWVTLINRNAHVPVLTSFPTGLILYIYSYTQWTLRLRITAAFTLITATEWILIGLLRH